MTARVKNMQMLLALRAARSENAERALARQHVQCEESRARVDAATARVVAYKAWQRERERELIGGLLGRVATINHIERVRDAFVVLDEQGEALERTEQEAGQAMRAAFELKQALVADRNQRRHEQDKMSALVARQRLNAVRRRELLEEIDQEERVRTAGRPSPC
jgi:hypothetical protein